MADAPARKRLLVVEDDLTCARLLRDALRTRYDVQVEGDGFTALERARQDPPDLLLLDLHLPTLSGFDVMEKWRQDPDLSSCPIVVVSARVMQGEQKRARAQGCHAFVAKPFSLQELREAVASALGVAP